VGVSETSSYPVRVDATHDPAPSRWLWLVKWLLAIPHYVILFFLWITLLVLTIVAFWAILFTGRYPRRIFDHNVGVLRWTWRVTYYAYGALGTDRYPPFTLHDVPDYPARLDVAYPGQLSRGLVLVKWWLLAIPHYVIVGILLGGSRGEWDDDRWRSGSPGLLGFLVFVVAVVLLFTGRYPRSLYDLVVGLNRWVFRVAGYATLMTDAYPPFRLDQGGHDPGSPGADEPHPPATPHGSLHWGVGRVLTVALGSLLAMTALFLGSAGAGAALISAVARDDDGYLSSPAERFDSRSYAITSESIHLDDDAPEAFLPERLLGDARFQATAATGSSLFLGVGPTADVEAYLAEVQYDVWVDERDGDPEFETHAGGPPPAPPTTQDFWTAQVSGPGTQTLEWDVESGDWTVVLMNADGSRSVSADVKAAATLPGIGKLVAVLLSLAGAALALGGLMVVLALTVGRRDVESGQRGTSAQ